MIKIRAHVAKSDKKLFDEVIRARVSTAVIQVYLAATTSLIGVAAAALLENDYIIMAYGVVQRLILIGCYVVTEFIQGYQPVVAYAPGAKMEEQFHGSAGFVKRVTLALSAGAALIYIACSELLTTLFNSNPVIITYGSRLLIFQVLLYLASGLYYMMTTTFQMIGVRRYVLFLSAIWQRISHILLVLVLPAAWGVYGIYVVQPMADILTLLVCLMSGDAVKRTVS